MGTSLAPRRWHRALPRAHPFPAVGSRLGISQECGSTGCWDLQGDMARAVPLLPPCPEQLPNPSGSLSQNGGLNHLIKSPRPKRCRH